MPRSTQNHRTADSPADADTPVAPTRGGRGGLLPVLLLVAVLALLGVAVSALLQRPERPVFELQSGPGLRADTPLASGFVINPGVGQIAALVPEGLQLRGMEQGDVEGLVPIDTTALWPITFTADGSSFAAARCLPAQDVCSIDVRRTSDGASLHHFDGLRGPILALFYNAAEQYVVVVDPRGVTSWYLYQPVAERRWEAMRTADGRWLTHEVAPWRPGRAVEVGGVAIDTAHITYNPRTFTLYALGNGPEDTFTYRSMLAAWRISDDGVLPAAPAPGQALLTFQGHVVGALDQSGRRLAVAPGGALLSISFGSDEDPPATIETIHTANVAEHSQPGSAFTAGGRLLLSPDGLRLASIGEGRALLWDATTMKLLQAYRLAPGGVRAAGFAANGDLLLVTQFSSMGTGFTYQRFYRLKHHS